VSPFETQKNNSRKRLHLNERWQRLKVRRMEMKKIIKN
jgi:hypothetical protein